MKLGYVIYYVKDVSETLKFYEKAFSFKTKFLHESNAYGELETGSTTLSFASFEMGHSNEIGFKNRAPGFESSDMEIGFITEDVASAHSHALNAGALEVKKPLQKPWGQTVSYVRDINGFLVEICSPM
jgi:lactoylglutathione lyase